MISLWQTLFVTFMLPPFFRKVQHSQWDVINAGLHCKKTHDCVKISRANVWIKHQRKTRLKRPTSPRQHSTASIIRNAFNFCAAITSIKWHNSMELLLKRCMWCVEICEAASQEDWMIKCLNMGITQSSCDSASSLKLRDGSVFHAVRDTY